MNYLKSGIIAVILLYIIYGIFFPHLPLVNADELWETSRAYYLKTHHFPGEPLLPASVSPFYASIGLMGWKSWWLITVKTSSFALMMKLLPVDELTAMRLAMFTWSMLACILTFLLAKKLELNKWFALLSTAILIALPDFFSQIHRERSEILICVSLLACLLLFVRALKSDNLFSKRCFYFLTGLFSWLPSFLIHPSAILIPACIGVLYLIFERKNIISLNTILIGIGLVFGCVFCLFLFNSMKEFAIAAGGGNYFNYQGPPILTQSIIYFIKLPFAFFTRFMSVNFLSRPVSFLIFIAGFIVLFQSVFTKRKYFSKDSNIIISVPVIVSLIVLYFLSGSFGSYNVIIAPYITISIGSFLQKQFAERVNNKMILPYSALGLMLVFASNAVAIPSDQRYAKEYKRITSSVRNAVKDNAPVLGIALYYNPFKDQNYYSNSWFNPYGGRSEQSFEEAVNSLNVKYIIVDDAFVGRAVLDRGISWTDSMMSFLLAHGHVINEFDALYDAGNRVPDPSKYPSTWRYEGQQKGFIKKIKVIRLED